MVQPLSAATVLEARETARRDITRLFAVLLGSYVLVFNGLALFVGLIGILFLAPLALDGPTVGGVLLFHLGATVAALGVAWLHVRTARRVPIGRLLHRVGAVEPDVGDHYHTGFVRIVDEVRAATGIRSIRSVVLPTTALNALAVQSGTGECAIGVTDGLLARLNRSELTAVICHEAAHLAHEDSTVTTLACSIAGVLDGIEAQVRGRIETKIRTRQDGVLFIYPFLWALTEVGRLLGTLLCAAISRAREFHADAQAVEMCRDPLSLAEALYTMSRGYGGSFDVPAGCSSLFFLSPGFGGEAEVGAFSRLFSTHPPIADRLRRLLAWARVDIDELKRRHESSRKPQAATKTLFYARSGNEWKGPGTVEELTSTDGVTPTSWISLAYEGELTRATCHAPFLAQFESQLNEPRLHERCPRCRTPLTEAHYEGAPVAKCTFCQGYLLRSGVLERIIARREKEFSAEEIDAAQLWRVSHAAALPELCGFPAVTCPLCGSRMEKRLHTCLTRVAIDRCSNPDCRAIWCDSGELERIQILVEADTRATV